MLGASWIAGVAAVWLLQVGQFGSCDVRGAGGRACWRLVAGWPWSAAGGWRRFGVVGFADPGGEDRKPGPTARAGLGSWFPGVWKAAATTARGCAKRTVAARLLAGLRAKPPGIAAGSGLVLYFLRGRHYACAVGRVPCPQGSPRRIRGFRRCLSRSQLAAPLVLLPLDDAGRRDRKHVHTGRCPREGHRVPDWCRLSLDIQVTGIAGIPARRSS
jgi:hypothetical protein